MAYLKFKYPLEFFTVLLSSNGNSADKIALYFDDAKNNNIKILPPSITKSIYNFSVKNGAVVFGLNAIKGIGNEIINKILNVRNTNNFTSYTQAMMLLAKNGVGIKTIETLIKAGCFDELLNGKTRFYLIKNLEEIFTKSKTATTDGKVLIQPKLINVVPTTDDIELLSQEQFNLLGVNFSKGSFDKLVKDYTGGFDLETLIDATSKPIGQVSHILVKILKYREIKTKTGAAMAFAKISDDSKNMDLTIFPGVYANAASILKNDNLYIITVKNDVRGLQALNIREYK
jgi:DNA polymerase-3 subunit alpha